MNAKPWKSRARRRFALLGLCYLAVVLLISAAVYFARNVANYILYIRPQLEDLAAVKKELELLGDNYAYSIFQFELVPFIITTTITFLAILAATVYKSILLKNGIGPLLVSLNARLLDENDLDEAEKNFLELVSEISESAELERPLCVVLDHEPGINAFSLGDPDRQTVVGLTAGALRVLDRDELKAVISHEMSHILHGDTLVNFSMIPLLHGLNAVYVYGVSLCSKGSGDGEASANSGPVTRGGMLVVGLLMMSVGYFGLFFSRLVKFMMCRRREYHSDAVAVSYIGEHHGLVSALKKIGGFLQHSYLRSTGTEEINHCFFAKPYNVPAIFDWFPATPPLLKRIRRWEKKFGGKYIPLRWTKRGLQVFNPGQDSDLPVETELSIKNINSSQQKPKEPSDSKARNNQQNQPISTAPSSSETNTERDLLQSVKRDVRIRLTDGNTELVYPRELFEQLPEALRQMAVDHLGSQAVILALLLSKSANLREDELREIAKNNDPQIQMETLRAFRLLEKCPVEYLASLAEFSYAGLQHLVKEEWLLLRENLVYLIGRGSPTELKFCIQRLVVDRLDIYFQTRVQNGIEEQTSTAELTTFMASDAVSQVLGSFAAVTGTNNETFHKSISNITEISEFRDSFEVIVLDKANYTFQTLEEALKKVVNANQEVRKKILTAVIALASQDSTISVSEAQIIRAVAAELDLSVSLAI